MLTYILTWLFLAGDGYFQASFFTLEMVSQNQAVSPWKCSPALGSHPAKLWLAQTQQQKSSSITTCWDVSQTLQKQLWPFSFPHSNQNLPAHRSVFQVLVGAEKSRSTPEMQKANKINIVLAWKQILFWACLAFHLSIPGVEHTCTHVESSVWRPPGKRTQVAFCHPQPLRKGRENPQRVKVPAALILMLLQEQHGPDSAFQALAEACGLQQLPTKSLFLQL